MRARRSERLQAEAFGERLRRQLVDPEDRVVRLGEPAIGVRAYLSAVMPRASLGVATAEDVGGGDGGLCFAD